MNFVLLNDDLGGPETGPEAPEVPEGPEGPDGPSAPEGPSAGDGDGPPTNGRTEHNLERPDDGAGRERPAERMAMSWRDALDKNPAPKKEREFHIHERPDREGRDERKSRSDLPTPPAPAPAGTDGRSAPGSTTVSVAPAYSAGAGAALGLGAVVQVQAEASDAIGGRATGSVFLGWAGGGVMLSRGPSANVNIHMSQKAGIPATTCGPSFLLTTPIVSVQVSKDSSDEQALWTDISIQVGLGLTLGVFGGINCSKSFGEVPGE